MEDEEWKGKTWMVIRWAKQRKRKCTDNQNESTSQK